MPIRWVICSVIEQDGGKVRLPLVATIPDPGIPPEQGVDDDGNPIIVFPTYAHSSVIDVGNWCLSFVRGVDMSGLDGNPDVINVFEPDSDFEDVDGFLAKSPNELGWFLGKVKRIKRRLENKGADFTGLTMDSPLWEILKRIGMVIWPNFKGPKGTWVK